MTTNGSRGWGILVFLLAAGALHAEKATEQSFLETFRKAQGLQESGSPEKALPYWKKAVEMAETLYGNANRNTAASYTNLAQAQAATGDDKAARSTYARAVSAWSGILGTNDPEVAWLRRNAADVSIRLGDFKNAVSLLDRALPVLRKSEGEESPLVADALYALGDACQVVGDHERAVLILAESLAIARRNGEKDEDRLFSLYRGLGISCTALDRYTEAASWHGEALSLCLSVLGDDAPLAGDVHGDLADAWFGAEDYEAAIRHYGEAHRIACLDPDEEDTYRASIQRKLGNAWISQGNSLIEAGEDIEARTAYESALAVFAGMTENTDADRASLYGTLAVLAKNREDRTASIGYTKEEIRLKSALWGEDHREAIAARIRLGELFQKEGDYGRSESSFQEALALCAGGKDAGALSDAYKALGLLDAERGFYDRSLSWLEKAREAWQSAPEGMRPEYTGIANGFAAVYLYQARYDEAIRCLQQGLEARLAANGGQEDLGVGILYANLGVAYDGKGELDRAIGCYEKSLALETAALGPVNPHVANNYCCIGVVYFYKKEYDKAIAYYQKALEIDRECRGPEDQSVAIDDNNIGEAYAAQGDHGKALEYYKEANRIWSARLGGAHWMTGVSHANIGEAYRGLKDYPRALESFGIALSIYRTALGEDHPRTAQVYSYVSILYGEQGLLPQAVEYAQKAVAVVEKSEERQTIIEYENALGLLLLAQGNPAAAESRFRRAISVIEEARTRTGSGRTEFLGRNLASYLYALRAAADLGDAEGVFAAAEGMKSRGFLEELSLEAAVGADGVDPADGKRLLELGRQRDELARQRTQEIAKPIGERDGTLIEGLTRKLEECEGDFDLLDARLMGNGRYRALRSPEAVDLAEACALCDGTGGILQYVLWEDEDPKGLGYGQRRRYCLVIRREGARIVELDRDFPVAEAVGRFRDALIGGNAEAREKEAALLYEKLVTPLARELAGLERLTIVPDGVLAFLPFDALRTAGGRYLCQEYQVETAPSVSVLRTVRGRAWDADRLQFLAFGGADYGSGAEETRGRARGLAVKQASGKSKDYYAAGDAAGGFSGYYANLGLRWAGLPGTREEVEAIERDVYAGRGSRVVTGGGVSEAAVKAMSEAGELARWRVVHFACHGYFDQDHPSRSAVVLSEAGRGGGEDGYLCVEDVALLRLEADLVALSACETGLGAVVGGDGVIGLTRAFSVAGANRVLVTLWQVDDAGTRDFMRAVYGRVVKEGMTFGRALSEAKREFLASARYADPWYWSPFVLYGG